MLLHLQLSWQFLYLSKIFASNKISVSLYLCMMLMLVWDDLLLMKWLYNNLLREEKKRRDGSGSEKED